MRVLIVVHHYPPNRLGGGELVAQRQAEWLTRQGIETRVVCAENITLGSSGLSWNDAEFESVPVRYLNLHYPDRTAALAAAYADPVLTRHLDEWISEWKPDLVHLISGYLLGTACLEAAHKHHLPTVVTLTDFWFLCPTIQLLKGDGSLCLGPEPVECARCLYDSQRVFQTIDRHMPRAMQKFWQVASAHENLGGLFGMPPLLDVLEQRRVRLLAALERADALLAVTRFLAEMYRKNGVKSANLLVKPNGLQLENFHPAEEGPPQDEIVLGYIGQIAAIKGIDVLVKGFRILRRANPTHCLRLLIYGKLNADARYLDLLQQLAEGDPAIEFCGAFENADVLRILSGMTALVVPSTWYENAPLVVQEAFAAGTPVLGSDVGGIAELVKDGENGLLFERGDANDMARKMQRFLDEPELGEHLRQGIPQVRTHEQDMQDLMQVYSRVLHPQAQATA